MTVIVRLVCAGLVATTLAACAGLANQPARAPTTDVNPITGARGGTGASH